MNNRNKPTMVTSRGLLKFNDSSVTLEDLKEAFFGGKVSRGSVSRCINARPELKSAIMDYSIRQGLPSGDIRQAMVHFFNNITSVPKCKCCSKPARFNRMLWGYSRYCSEKCQNRDPDVKSKHEATNIRLYGVANAAKSQQVKDKMKATVRNKYGADCYLASEVGRKHLKNVLMSRYGVSASYQIPGVQEKRAATMFAKYGVRHALQSKEFKSIQETTCMEKYGTKYPGTWKLKELAKSTRDEIYDNLGKVFPEYEIQCSKEDFLGIYEHENTWKCMSCGAVFSRYGAPMCHCKYKWVTQEEIFKFIKGLCPDAVFGDRTVLSSGKELDVYVPSRKMAFEYDGLYWHSENQGKSRRYHVTKTEEAFEKGIRLIHIFEDEWLYKPKLVKTKIRAILGRHLHSIYARKCKVVELGREEAERFLDKYHIQGPAKSKVSIGLTYRGHLVAVCTFTPKCKSDNIWYLDRYAAVNSFRVQGGCGKLLAYFCRKNNPACVRTFADRRWSTGEMYERIGFKLKFVSPPVYWYVRKGEFTRIHRFNLRKDNKKMFPDKYSTSMTESELAAANGYLRIWDCGQLVYDYIPYKNDK